MALCGMVARSQQVYSSQTIIKMIDVRRIHFDGELNIQGSLRFYATRHPLALSLLIKKLGDKKKDIMITIYQEHNHGRPHVHIDGHNASFAIDNGERLAGRCDSRTQNIVKRWIRYHRKDLEQLWRYVQKGADYVPTIAKIREDKGFEDFGFKGKEPKNKKEIEGIVVWYDGELSEEKDGEKRKFICDGDIYVGYKNGIEENGVTFESRNGKVINGDL